jgi:hypothetical protein
VETLVECSSREENSCSKVPINPQMQHQSNGVEFCITGVIELPELLRVTSVSIKPLRSPFVCQNLKIIWIKNKTSNIFPTCFNLDIGHLIELHNFYLIITEL